MKICLRKTRIKMIFCPMYFKLPMFFKSFITIIQLTLVYIFPQMNLCMFSHITALSEGFSTARTNIIFLSSVNSNVFYKNAICTKSENKLNLIKITYRWQTVNYFLLQYVHSKFGSVLIWSLLCFRIELLVLNADPQISQIWLFWPLWDNICETSSSKIIKLLNRCFSLIENFLTFEEKLHGALCTRD